MFAYDDDVARIAQTKSRNMRVTHIVMLHMYKVARWSPQAVTPNQNKHRRGDLHVKWAKDT